ncbi:hypothetical protein BTI21_09285 [Lactobacillus delbrueckii subsp. bulgaricus]|nr:hypothetical protein [Lactobacillus delbrueckii subsp. bulgaricus]MBT8826220.1 hypothetical protein [Lactobacillus delbrueckii subsp. bulgaricus]MBT8846880.1 hypothetical protein [Lactobacillus delbrueckii subsp. bulgaricus]MBT8870639.1 hypothetical protein [Lactobacillus delbrueckii subsp. bulgaricus]MBT8903587.1 hypothetical protein [Lactobacillus delbrueckii subsp. bulgaricus]
MNTEEHENPIVPLELLRGRFRSNNWPVLNLKSKGGELSFYSDATNELMIEVVDRFLSLE